MFAVEGYSIGFGVLLLLRIDKSEVFSSIQLGINGLFLMVLLVVSCSSVKMTGHEVNSLMIEMVSRSFSGIENESLAKGFVQVLGPFEISAAAFDKLIGIKVPAGLENWRRATGRGMTELWKWPFEEMVPRLSKLYFKQKLY